MRYFLRLALIGLLPLFAEAINEGKVEKYFLDYSYLEKFDPEILGIYVIDTTIPDKISELTFIMAELLNQYLYIKENDIKDSVLDNLLKKDLVAEFSKKHYNYFTEIRNVELLLSDTKKDLYARYIDIKKYISNKRSFYGRQSNEMGISFCDDIEKFVLKPILNGFEYTEVDISNWGMSELKLAWNDFKKKHLNLIQTYFRAKEDDLSLLNHHNTLEVKVSAEDSNKKKIYYLKMKLFGQDWYLELDDYLSELHKIHFIKL